MSPGNSLQSSILDPLKTAMEQNKLLKTLLEESIKKVKCREMELKQLQAGKNNCATLELETLKPQVTTVC